MTSRFLRGALGAGLLTAIAVLPATASAQLTYLCTSGGLVCGAFDAKLVGNVLTVRASNLQGRTVPATAASVIFGVSVGFTGPAFALTTSIATTAATFGGVTIYNGPVPWTASVAAGLSQIDLASFDNSYIEGTDATFFRTDPFSSVWSTWGSPSDTYVEFSADVSGWVGAGQSISGIGFMGATDTDFDSCDVGACTAAVVTTPEPATIVLLAAGLTAALGLARRRKIEA